MNPKAFEVLAELGPFPPRREDENRGVYKTLALSPVLICWSQQESRRPCLFSKISTKIQVPRCGFDPKGIEKTDDG